MVAVAPSCSSSTSVCDGFVVYKIESAQTSVYRKAILDMLIFSVPLPAVNINFATRWSFRKVPSARPELQSVSKKVLAGSVKVSH